MSTERLDGRFRAVGHVKDFVTNSAPEGADEHGVGDIFGTLNKISEDLFNGIVRQLVT